MNFANGNYLRIKYLMNGFALDKYELRFFRFESFYRFLVKKYREDYERLKD